MPTNRSLTHFSHYSKDVRYLETTKKEGDGIQHAGAWGLHSAGISPCAPSRSRSHGDEDEWILFEGKKRPLLMISDEQLGFLLGCARLRGARRPRAPWAGSAFEFAARYRAEVPDRCPGAGTRHADGAQTQVQLADDRSGTLHEGRSQDRYPLFEAVEVA